MSHTTAAVAVSRPRVALLMVFCGIFGAAGAASAATPTDDVPKLVVRFPADSLTTDSGARTLYRRLVRAAETVCPATASDRPFVSRAVQQCRDQAVARAVQQIDNPRLGAVYAANSKGAAGSKTG